LGKEFLHILIVDKSTDHVEPHFDLVFYHNISAKEMFSSKCELKKALHDSLTQAAWYGLSSTIVN